MLTHVARAAFIGTVLIMALGGCGDGDGEKGTVTGAEQLLPEPLASAGTTLIGVPLPEGAEPAPATPGNDTFKVGPPVTLSDVNAFYKREMDDRPFGDLPWCRSDLDEMAKTVTRYWGGPDTDEYLTIVIGARTVSEPTLIVVRRQAGPVPTPCESP